ncbi:MAG: alkaline phosphatase, partial [Puniceicoccaceae bacterium]
MKPQLPSRREFLKGAGAIGASGLFLGSHTAAAAGPERAAPRAKARNLIFLVVDGMGTGTLSLAHHWHLRHKDSPSNWTRFYGLPGVVTSLQDTASASSPVTDSAAAGSAWGGGQRIPNGAINVTADGKALTPLWTHAREAGKATGLVSTCRITHATSAAFAANVADRDREDAIAGQYLEREIDVLLGGGLRHFKNPGRDLLPGFEKKGYHLARDAEELRAAKGKRRILGLFTPGHLPYAIDRENDERLGSIPGLVPMFETALASLAGSENGFVLQVEAGRVDHAGHDNDPAAILREQLEFDRCIAVAERFLRKHPDTLLILTTDHGTGGCQLNGWGVRNNDSGPALDRINAFTDSFEALERHYRSIGRFDPDHFEAKTGIRPAPEQSTELQLALETDTKLLNRLITRLFAGKLLALTGVGWTSNNHTAECVELLALGPGIEGMPAFIKNQELHGIMREAL